MPFDGGYRAWRAAVAGGWTVAGALEAEAKRLAWRPTRPRARRRTGLAPPRARVDERDGPRDRDGAHRRQAPRPKAEKLSKDAYRKQRTALDAELTRLGLRKNHLELAMGDPAVAANFVELRRVTSELADVDAALAAAEDAWLELEERAP